MLQAIQINAIEPVLHALSTPEGWIGLLLGLGGRETARAINRIIQSVRGQTDGD